MSRRTNLIKKKKVCQYCGRKVGDSSGTLDHFIPKSKGGIRSKRNIKLACKKCNSVKGDMDGDKWMKILPVLLEASYMDMSKAARRRWRKDHPEVFPYNKEVAA